MKDKDKEKDLNFEKALADLEQTVDRLEKGKLSLNDSLALFEKGVKLARFLRDELDRAEKKIEILLKDEKGELRRAAFDLEGGDEGDADAADAESEEGETGGAPAKKSAKSSPKKKPEDGDKGGGDVLPF
jgi:exodeoxyribonuclease VII small subunit